MFAYNLHWKAKRSMLLYPKVDQEDSNFGKYSYRAIHLLQNKHQEFQNECKLGFVSVLNSKGEIKKGELLSEEVFSKLETE